MALSKELIDQFTKLTTPEKKDKSSVLTGTYKKIADEDYVRIDGSNIYTPVNTLVETNEDDRVSIEIKDHVATIIGNITSPSANIKSVSDVKRVVDDQGNTITQLNNNIIQQNNTITQMDNKIVQQNNTIIQIGNTVNQQNDNIESMNNTITQMDNKIVQQNNTIVSQGNSIESMNNTIKAHGSSITSIGDTVTSQGNTIISQGNQIIQNGNNINTANNNITILNSGFNIKDGKLTGLSDIVVENLETEKLDTKYANIDFANIGTAAVEKLFADSGIIKNLVVDNQHITGELVGVTINGDLINANTLKADKLVVKGSDGLYYKLNVDGERVEAQQTDQNSLNGSIITAKSITATKINVSDLVAFNATIGGFDITNSSINTHGKSDINSNVLGLFLGKDGQFYLGDDDSHVKFSKDANGEYKLDIAATEIHIGANSAGVSQQIENLNNDYSDLSDSMRDNYTSLDSKINTTNSNLKDYATKDYADTINNDVGNIKANTYNKSEIDKKMTDGSVTKVYTLNGTFDDNGMHYYRKGAPTETTINEYGVRVDATSSKKELLFAGYDPAIKSTIVRTDNLTTRHYLIVGEHARLQAYGKGMGLFII